MTMEDINKEYRELCTLLGDIIVKQKGLDNQKAQLFQKLEELDQKAAETMKAEQETKMAAQETSETRGI